MISIATHGCIIHDVDLEYRVMKNIMEDNFIKDYQFIDFKFADGGRGSVKKGSIEFFHESEEEEGMA